MRGKICEAFLLYTALIVTLPSTHVWGGNEKDGFELPEKSHVQSAQIQGQHEPVQQSVARSRPLVFESTLRFNQNSALDLYNKLNIIVPSMDSDGEVDLCNKLNIIVPSIGSDGEVDSSEQDSVEMRTIELSLIYSLQPAPVLGDDEQSSCSRCSCVIF